MSPRLRLMLSILALAGVFVIGAVGYLLIESDRDLTFAQAAYMTAITVSTVGYTEVWELSDGGRLWTMGIIVFGIATVSIAFTSLIALFVSGELRSLRETKRMETKLKAMSDHIIVCGYGRMGQLVTTQLAERSVPCVVIELDRDREDDLRKAGLPFLIADATEEETMVLAGLMEARAVIALLPRDTDNVFVTLTAHTLRRDLFIVARAEQPSTQNKLQRAGATRVICPQVIGATKIANVITRPNVVDFVEMANKGVELEMDEVVLTERSPLCGVALKDSGIRERTGAIVVAIKRREGETLFNPVPDAKLMADDTLVLIGPADVSGKLGAFQPPA